MAVAVASKPQLWRLNLRETEMGDKGALTLSRALPKVGSAESRRGLSLRMGPSGGTEHGEQRSADIQQGAPKVEGAESSRQPWCEPVGDLD